MKVRVTARRGLNVRAGPGVFYRRVGGLHYGAAVEVRERRGVWGRIAARDVSGWIHLGYTVEVDEKGQDEMWLPGAQAVDLSAWNRVTGRFWTSERPWATIVKATQGVFILDRTFGKRWARLRFLDWRRWAYHFYDPKHPGRAQASMFLRVTGLQPGERAVLDLEWLAPQEERRRVAGEVRDWLHIVADATGTAPVVYTRRDVWMYYFGPKGAGVEDVHPLWVADYRPVAMPLEVPGWARPALWQYTSRGRWPGVRGNVDLSRVARWFAEAEDGNGH